MGIWIYSTLNVNIYNIIKKLIPKIINYILSRDITEEYEKRLEQEQGTDDLHELVNQLVPYFMENNAEHDAIDLLIEVDIPEKLVEVLLKFKNIILTLYILIYKQLYSA